jgi:putative membrane protein
MATARGTVVGDHPLATTAVVSLVGYGLVASAFLGAIPIPEIGRGTVILLSDLIAVVNSVALVLLVAGYRFIRRGDVRRHRAAMLSAFALIMVFLVMYLIKVGGGFEKALVVEAGRPLAAYAGTVRIVYLAMLAVHVLLSVVSVPVVLYAVVLGLTRPVAELPETAHPRVGRLAVAAWTLSLFLRVVTYLLLNHVYAWEPVARSMALLVVAVPESLPPSQR